MIRHLQVVFFVLCCLLTFCASAKEERFSPSSSQHSVLSSQGSNGSFSGSKRTWLDLNKPVQSYDGSNANSMQNKHAAAAIKDTASSPVRSSPSTTPAKRVKRVPNPFPKGSHERALETNRRQKESAIAAHQRRKQRLAL